MTLKKPLRALQESAKKNKKLYQYNAPDPSVLEFFDSPRKSSDVLDVNVRVDEFTTLCPMTGQPDYGKLFISYRPKDRCLESKSFKLYLMGYRQHGAFHEQIVTQVALDLFSILHPRWLQVKGSFNARGGISFNPYYKISDCDISAEEWAALVGSVGEGL